METADYDWTNNQWDQFWGNKTVITRDVNNNITRVERQVYTGTSYVTRNVLQYTYDGQGRLAAIVESDGMGVKEDSTAFDYSNIGNNEIIETYSRFDTTNGVDTFITEERYVYSLSATSFPSAYSNIDAVYWFDLVYISEVYATSSDDGQTWDIEERETQMLLPNGGYEYSVQEYDGLSYSTTDSGRYELNAQCHVTRDVEYEVNNGVDSLVYGQTNTHTYDNDNNLTETITRGYSSSLMQFVNVSRSVYSDFGSGPVDTTGPVDTNTVGVSVAALDVAIQLFPNPVSSVLNIQVASTDEIVTATLVNITGVKVIEQRLQVGANSINVSRYPAGVYLLQLANAKGEQQIQKLIVE